MCFRLFVIFVLVVLFARLIRIAIVWAHCRKEADQIIANGDGPSVRIEQLIHMFHNKGYLGKRDKARLDGLLSIRNIQIKGVRYVESEVREDKSDL